MGCRVRKSTTTVPVSGVGLNRFVIVRGITLIDKYGVLGGALSRDTLPIQNQPCLSPELPLYPNTLLFCTLAASMGVEPPISYQFRTALPVRSWRHMY